jgi:hypothetical protein
MSVIRLVARSNKETVETLEWMLQEALDGRLSDFMSQFRDDSGRERHAITGVYRSDPAKAVMALTRMTRLLTSEDTLSGR